MIVAVAVTFAGGIGALARYLVDASVRGRMGGAFPWGTLMVNISGSFVLGLLTGVALSHGLPDHLGPVLGTGLCGGLTTWSTASWESVRLVESGLYRDAGLQAVGGLVVAACAAAAGISLGAL